MSPRVSPRRLWTGVGYGLTAAWMVGVLVVTNSDPAHPLFDFIFVVPLIGWIVAIGVQRLARRRRPDPPNPDRDP